MSQYEHFGPPEAPGPFEGFSGPPSQGPTEGSRGRAEGPDRQSDAVARDRSKGDGASSVRRCRRPGTRSFERRTRFVRIVESAGEASPDEALLQNVDGKKGSRLAIRYSKPTTVKKLTYEFLRSNQEAGRDLRAQTSDGDLYNSLSAPQPQREREFLIGPLDT